MDFRLLILLLLRKKELISNLEARGVFKFKGAVNSVAHVLGVSSQTIYRYLQQSNKE